MMAKQTPFTIADRKKAFALVDLWVRTAETIPPAIIRHRAQADLVSLIARALAEHREEVRKAATHVQ